MTLIKSISGFRGTIGALPGDNLTPVDIVRFATGYARWLQQQTCGQVSNAHAGCAAGAASQTPSRRLRVVVGRDARISGKMVEQILCGTLSGCGVDVINLGLATTPTVEMAVTGLEADGGIILTASHNPAQWNALKLLNAQGEFLSAADGSQVIDFSERSDYAYASADALGTLQDASYLEAHVQAILALPLVDVAAIRAARFRVVVDPVNSVGSLAIPRMLEALGVEDIQVINGEPNGLFAHNPEPLAEHLTEISAKVYSCKADLGIVVDPDVDRLALICEDGSMFGEEYTLVAVADYVLSQTPGNTVSNLSSSRALRDVTERRGGAYLPAAVGEVNVVSVMKQSGAVIGGEGNGGVIYPPLHYGRDALVGVALFLSHLARTGGTVSALRASYPAYFMSKNKVVLSPDKDPGEVLSRMQDRYASARITTVDGLRVDFEERREWVHLRKSNTEPIIRVYAESPSQESADALARSVMDEISSLS
jgi:phosphomannomutase